MGEVGGLDGGLLGGELGGLDGGLLGGELGGSAGGVPPPPPPPGGGGGGWPGFCGWFVCCVTLVFARLDVVLAGEAGSGDVSALDGVVGVALTEPDKGVALFEELFT